MQATIYRREGIRVVATGTLAVVLPTGIIVDTYPLSDVNEAVQLTDELAATGEYPKAA